ncbi:MAG TPA: hypothetical protein PK191_10705 [Niabella sp.]|nr:hypothetical protein [Niabella sp.]HOZ97729.1 hypothetical protein [Niabella sp.]HQW14044.1 hypothetical protein [Niabella sp.]HQX19413.1 hypothetical protein [Niabella sp.]HQX40234.1 hypothetical protein [Niabella sp.]
MNHFIEHIIARHSIQVPQVQPRLTGRFESQGFASNYMDSVEGFEQADSASFNRNDLNKKKDTALNDLGNNPVTDNLEKENKEAATSLIGENSSLLINLMDADGFNKKTEKQESFQNGNTNLKSDRFMSKADTKQDIHSEWSNSDSEHFSLQTQQLNDSSISPNQSENTHRLDGDFFKTNPPLTRMPFADELKLPVNNSNAGQSVIKVSIGRIEVRATSAPAQGNISGSTQKKTRMSLDDYFKSRKNA